jgi:hypothetical protein
MRWRNVFICGIGVLLLLGGFASEKSAYAESGISKETKCKDSKLRAAGKYFECLFNAYAQPRSSNPDHLAQAISSCGRRFGGAFQRAEKGGACRTVGGAATFSGLIKEQVGETADTVAAGAGCQDLKITPGETAVCTLASSTSAIDLEAIISQIQGQGENVDDNTVFWIEAWAGDGGPGHSSDGGSAGVGGYAQTTATVNGYQAFFGTTDLYYYFGINGIYSSHSGGDGGTATIISSTDLSGSPPPATPLIALLAGGGGGGGAGNSDPCGIMSSILGGGAGAIAIANSTNPMFIAGDRGDERRNTNVSGHGGGGDFAATGGKNGGGTSTDGDSGLAPLGGQGGYNSPPQTGFVNQVTSMTLAGGKGGSTGDEAGGGGGGGGWGAGGGGQEGTIGSNCVSGGGGGGGSYAVGFQGATASCSAAPTQMPTNPNGSVGFARITFDLSGTCK